MKKEGNSALNIFLRYAIMILFGILNAGFFYIIFTPLTIYPVYFLLKIFFGASLIGNVLFVHNFPVEIIGACVAGSAYLLLLVLNLSTPKIKLSRRIGIFFFSFSLLLAVNVLRIFTLSGILVSGSSLFDLAHKIFWYAGSILFVAGIWFLSVKLFKLKEIPFYSDIKYLWNKLRKDMKKSKHSKKH
ncbi:Uncharacterised protein [uncultured archaeon]|nr:Uncharacterised protein [uncultured archaeon]